MREQILTEIRRITAVNGGLPPGSRLFERETGISTKNWRGVYWARWSEALTEAGLTPNSKTEKVADEKRLAQLAEVVRHFGKWPPNIEFRMFRNSHPDLPTDKTLTSAFGTRQQMLERLSNWSANRDDYRDVAERLAPHIQEVSKNLTEQTRTEGLVYLIKSGTHYKIGRSDELERRVKEIKVALPEAATLVHAIRTDDPPGIEAYWHRRFADRRANGEWFKLSSADVSAFKRRKFQ